MNNTTSGPLQELTPHEVRDLLAAHRILLVDVREPDEFAVERIAGALLYPLSTFEASRLPPDDGRPLVFQCGSGKRSAIAAHKRLAAGATKVAHLRGGIGAWKAARLPTISIDPATGKSKDT
jgi:rhodanese-related sulfurtransferase